jgi:hypothetical protein
MLNPRELELSKKNFFSIQNFLLRINNTTSKEGIKKLKSLTSKEKNNFESGSFREKT